MSFEVVLTNQAKKISQELIPTFLENEDITNYEGIATVTHVTNENRDLDAVLREE